MPKTLALFLMLFMPDKVQPLLYSSILSSDNIIKIYASVTVENVNSINTIDMDFNFDFFLTQSWLVSGEQCRQYKERIAREYNWTEERLLADQIMLKGDILNIFWLPDTFLTNAKIVNPTTYDNGFRSIAFSAFDSECCNLTYALRLSALVPCHMNFRWYPADTQRCSVPMRSASYSNRRIEYYWQSDALIVNSNIALLQHEMIVNYSSKIAIGLNRIRYSWLILQFTFCRRLSYHIIQIYVPTILLVAISYCGFWMGNDVFPGRISLGITTQLALITQFSGVRARLPQVSYINAVDVWMIVCMLFVFSTILITTIVVALEIRPKHRTSSSRIEQLEDYPRMSKTLPWYSVFPEAKLSSAKNGYLTANGNNGSRLRPSIGIIRTENIRHSQVEYVPERSVQLDAWCKVVYPILFIFFNTIYWSLLLTHT